MSESVKLPTGAQPDADNPGWYSWGDFPRGSFASRTGRLLFRPDGPGQAICRMYPDESHLNMGGSIHGGAVMSFIDMSLFAGGRCAGMAEGHYVTLDCSTRFIARVWRTIRTWASRGSPIRPRAMNRVEQSSVT